MKADCSAVGLRGTHILQDTRSKPSGGQISVPLHAANLSHTLESEQEGFFEYVT